MHLHLNFVFSQFVSFSVLLISFNRFWSDVFDQIVIRSVDETTEGVSVDFTVWISYKGFNFTIISPLNPQTNDFSYFPFLFI